MRDQIEAQLWADHGPQFSADMAKALRWVMQTFCAIKAIRFRAPWRGRSEEAC
jgi:hypothetical protein